MRVPVSNGKRMPFKGSTTTFYLSDSTTDSSEAERIREERQVAEYLRQLFETQQQQNGGSADANNVDGQDLLKNLVTEVEMKRSISSTSINLALDDSPDAGLVETINVSRQPILAPSEYEMGFDGTQIFAGPSIELQNRQKWVEEEELQRQADSAVREAVTTEMEVKSTETETVSPLFVSGQLMSCGLDSMDTHIGQSNQENIIERSDDDMIVYAEQNRQLVERVRRPSPTSPVNRSKDSLRPRRLSLTSPVNRSKDSLRPRRLRPTRPVNRSKDSLRPRRLRPTRPVNRSKDSLRKGKQVPSNIRLKRCNLSAKKALNDGEKSLTYSCDLCGKQLKQKKYLARHLSNHTGEKRFPCKECDAAFFYKGDLTKHEMIHSGARPFKCLICNVAFNQRGNLSTHMLIHKNEKPYTCDICNRSFRQKTTLLNHQKIHRGEKPYECNVCKKTFRQISNLSSHLKVHVEK